MAVFSTEAAIENFSLETQVNTSNPYIHPQVYWLDSPNPPDTKLESLFPSPVYLSLEVETGPIDPNLPSELMKAGIFGKIVYAAVGGEDDILQNEYVLNFAYGSFTSKPLPSLMRGEIAKYAGFYWENKVLKWKFNRMKIDELTYFIVFRITSKMSDGQAAAFEDRYSLEERLHDCNKIRLAFWGDPGINGRKIKRLHKNGDQENYDGNEVPSSISPIFPKKYITEDDYLQFGVTVHQSIKQEHFSTVIDLDENLLPVLMQIPLEYYLKKHIETPFFTAWVQQGYSRPFFPHPRYPTANSGTYVKVKIKPLNNTTKLQFYPEWRKKTQYNTPYVSFVVSASSRQIVLNGFREVEQAIIIANKDKEKINIGTGTVGHNKKGELIRGNNIEQFIHVLLDNGQIGDKFKPNYLLGEYIQYNGQGQQRIKSKEGKLFLTICIPHHETFIVENNLTEENLFKLEGHRVFGTNVGEKYIVFKGNSDITINSVTNSVTAGSGLTMGLGVDLGNADGFVDNPANATNWIESWISNVKNETFIDSNNILLNMIPREGNDAVKYWKNNRKFFDINCDFRTENNWNWSKALFFAINFAHEKYYLPGLNKLNNLITEPNVIEKFALLTIAWNGPAHPSNGKFAKAINQHDYNLLRDAVNSSSGNNQPKVYEMLFKSGKIQDDKRDSEGNLSLGDTDITIDVELVKKYFRDYHLNDIK